MNTLKRLMPRGGFAYNVSVLAGSTAVGQVVGVLAAPLLSRLYTPEDFGAMGVYTSVFMLLNVISSLRYEYAINLADDDHGAANALGLTLALVAGSSLALLLTVPLWAAPVADWLNVPTLSPYLWLLPLSLLGAGVYTAFNYWALRQGSFGALGRTRVTQSLTNTGILLLFGVLATGPFGLLLGHASAQSAGSSTLVRLSWRQNSAALRGINRQDMKQMGRRYGRFAVLTSASALVNTAGAQVPRLLLSSLYGSTVTGWFTFGQRIFAIPLSLVGVSVGQVFLSTAARLARENPPALQRFFFKTVRRLFVLGLVPAGVLMLFGASLFAFVFGPQWETAGYYAQLLAPAFLIQFVISSVSQVMFIVQRANVQLAWDILRLTSVGGVFVAASVFAYTDEQVVLLYSITLIVTYSILFAVQWLVLRAFIQKGVADDEPGTNPVRDSAL
jgi:O-antigen/teichoic acid export membrane protein